MKNVLKAFGLIALVAVFGFSMVACDDNSGGGGGLPAPTGLSAWRANSTTINLSWNSVSGAHHYNVYCSTSPSSGYSLVGARDVTSAGHYNRSIYITYYYKVAAVDYNGREGRMSSYVSAYTY